MAVLLANSQQWRGFALLRFIVCSVSRWLSTGITWRYNNWTMNRPLFLPTVRQTNWLLIIGFLCVGEALYLRYMAIENANVALACQAGLKTWLCGAWRMAIVLFSHEVFGAVALTAALLNLIRPSLVLIGLALAAAAFGLVLHNADLSALAAGALILSLARRAPAPE